MIIQGDSLEKLKKLGDNSVDAVVTDPPYGLSFMGKKWDYDVPTTELWAECLRVLKPGGHLLAFFGTRTYHRGVVRIEDAGFEIRDQIMWIYGSGFPKSHDISKAIDKAAGAEREVVGKKQGAYDNAVRTKKTGGFGNSKNDFGNDVEGFSAYDQPLTAPATDLAKQWQGWGTALKPANEPIVVARKPLEKGLTIAENVVKWGTGALNIDESRIEASDIFGGGAKMSSSGKTLNNFSSYEGDGFKASTQGRWPANVLFDEVASELLDEQSGILKQGGAQKGSKIKSKSESLFFQDGKDGMARSAHVESDTYGASRFFYVAKASKRERNAGCEGMPKKVLATSNHGQEEPISGRLGANPLARQEPVANFHPTVKPIKLMQYLIKLVTPPNGTVLDPFMGSGSTGVAAKELGFGFVGIELSKEYFEIAKARLKTKKVKKAKQLELEVSA